MEVHVVRAVLVFALKLRPGLLRCGMDKTSEGKATISVNPGDYAGLYYDPKRECYKGVSHIELAPGEHYVSVYGMGSGTEIRFTVTTEHTINPGSIKPACAACVFEGALTFNTIKIPIVSGEFKGGHCVAGYPHHFGGGEPAYFFVTGLGGVIQFYQEGYQHAMSINVSANGAVELKGYDGAMSVTTVDGQTKLVVNSRPVLIATATPKVPEKFKIGDYPFTAFGTHVVMVVNYPANVYRDTLTDQNYIGTARPGKDAGEPVPFSKYTST